MIDWITGNYQWFFSGLGVFLLVIIIGFTKRRRMKRTVDIKNIRVGDKTRISIIQSEGNVQINYPNLKDMKSTQIVTELLEGKRPEALKLEAKLANENGISDDKEKKAVQYNNRAIHLGREGRYNESLVYIRKAIDMDPEEERYKENLVTLTENYAGSLVMHSNLFDRTISLMENLREEGLLNDGYGYWILGYSYFGKRLYEEAISAYQQAVAFEPEDHLHHVYLAEAYSYKGIRDKDMSYQEEALNEMKLSLQLDCQKIKGSGPLNPSFTELVLLNALSEINKREPEPIKAIERDYEHFLFRLGCYSSNEITEIMEGGRLSFTLAAVALDRYKNMIEEKIGGRVDVDTLMNGVKTVEEIQAMVKDATNKEIPITALSKLLQMTQVNEKEKVDLANDLAQSYGVDEILDFARELDKVLKKRKRWIFAYPPEEDDNTPNIA